MSEPTVTTDPVPAASAPSGGVAFQRTEANDLAARYPIPRRLNLVIIAVQLTAALAILWAAGRVEAWWQVALLAVGFAVVGNSIYSVIHEAEHRMLHPRRRLNDALGVLMALFFPAPYHLIRQGHIGHHQRNRSDDEAFDLYFEGDSRLLQCVQFYGIVTGAYWVMVAVSNVVVMLTPGVLARRHFEFNRSSAAFMDSLNPRYWTLIRLEAAAAIALHAFLIWSLDVPPLRYLAVYFGFGFSWSAMQYVHHYGTERHVLDGSRNLWLFAPVDWLWLHHNWHRAHHRHPTVPWVHLPRVGRDEDPGREFLIRHYLRMWRGPQYSEERVQNRYAGRVIQ